MVPLFAVAETFTVVVAPTALVLTTNVPLALPARTVILAGIDAIAEPPLTAARVTTVF